MSTKKYGNGLGGNLHNFGRGLLAISTLGASNLFVKKREGQEETNFHTEKVFICQNCGFSSTFKTRFNAKDPAEIEAELAEMRDPNNPIVRKAVEICIKRGKFSTAYLQTRLGKGHIAMRTLEKWLDELGVLGEPNGNKPRDVLIHSVEEFDKLTTQQ